MTSLLRKFEADVQQAGLVRETLNAKIVLLTAASARLPRPLNLTVCGPSAAGKNALIEYVARFLPDEHKKFLTGMTPKALMHSGEDEFQHKAVFIAEFEGVRGADYPIRTFQSEQRIEWEFVDSTDKDGLKKKRKTVRGPAAFIQATTRVSLHPENETRLLFIHIDESPEQTQSINLRQAQVASGKTEACPSSLFESWHSFFRGLKENRVRIPFAEQLAFGLPSDRIRSRRDFPKLLSLIECSAYLHQNERSRTADGIIVAGPDDYHVARALFPVCLDTALDKSTAEFLRCLEHESEGFEFSAPEIMRRTGWKKTKTYEVLARLEEVGCVAPTERRSYYRLVQRTFEPTVKLPEKLRLSADEFRFSAKTPPYGDSPDGIRAIT